MALAKLASRLEGLLCAGEARVRAGTRVAHKVLLRHPAVLEDELGGIGGADAQLVLAAHEGQGGGALLHHEALDPGLAEGRVRRGPHDQQVSPLARRDVDLGAV